MEPQTETKPWTPTPGDRVYLGDGTEAVYIGQSEAKHCVRVCLEENREEDGNDITAEYLDEPRLVSVVFRDLDSFHARRQEELDRTQKRITEMRKEETALRERINKATLEVGQLYSRVRQHDALKRIEDFLEGRVQWVVVVSWTDKIEIKSLEELQNKEESRWDENAGIKLLTLFGKTNGDLGWRLNHYSDGSGSSFEAYPFATREEADEKAAQLWEARWEEIRARAAAGLPINLSPDTIQKYAPEIPEDIAKIIWDMKAKQHREKVAAAAKTIEDLEAERQGLLAAQPGAVLPTVQ